MLRPALTGVFLAALLSAFQGVLAGSAGSLEYVDISLTGGGFPSWDGGDTELCFADVNADGNVDLLSIGDHGSPYVNTQEHGIMVYFGDGQHGWSLHMEGDFGYGGIAVGDANNDGLLDVAYGMHHNCSGTDLGDQLLEVALGNGTGTAWTPWDDGLASNGEDWGMFATDFGDIDNDGLLDVVSNSFGCCNGIHVYRNNGDGTWTQTWAYTGSNSSSYVRFADVNGDGFLDVVASYQLGTVWVGDGEGGFVACDTGLPGIGSIHEGVCAGDVNGDGCEDISFTLSGRVYVYVWEADHWEPAVDGLPTATDYVATYLYDMNSDGFMDLLAMGSGTVKVWLGNGTGSWEEETTILLPEYRATAALEAGGDIDHNGFPDFALVYEKGDWWSGENVLLVYAESSSPVELGITANYPTAHCALPLGSARVLRWTSSEVGTEEASVDIDLSLSGPDGPWEPVAEGLPDCGHYQWAVSGAPTEDAVLRFTLRQGREQAVAMTPEFRIVAGSQARRESGTSGARMALWPSVVTPGTSLRILLPGGEGTPEARLLGPDGRQVGALPLLGLEGVGEYQIAEFAVPRGVLRFEGSSPGLVEVRRRGGRLGAWRIALLGR